LSPDDERVYSLDSLKRRVENLERQKQDAIRRRLVFPDKKLIELNVLSDTLAESEQDLKELTYIQQEWLLMFQRVQTQRYGYGLCLAPLIHSEVWLALEKRGWKGDAKIRAFANIVALDVLYVKTVSEADQEKKKKGNNDPELGLKKLQNQTERKATI